MCRSCLGLVRRTSSRLLLRESSSTWMTVSWVVGSPMWCRGVLTMSSDVFLQGILSLLVLSIDGPHVRVRCLNNGTLSSRKGVNLPKTAVDIPALSEKDKADLAFGVKNGVDMIFASFIRSARDVQEIRKVLGPE